jgi:hypothetical protein
MLTIEVDGQLEQRLKEAAASAGAAPQEVAERLLNESLPKSNAATLAILAKWQREKETIDPEELQRGQEETERLMEALARNRLESEGPDAGRLNLRMAIVQDDFDRADADQKTPRSRQSHA